ncbi:hypothetical protein LTR56_013651 [Elasticomyces elasticus]|nr:hypothetical protein LTR22_023715 [Elasticomyces elasticus]KAK3637478.1 hypothetical protein LTR56_013651 [Elasticomyces elasticus]KAK4917862.1 hypothetical protein LTR49_014266 [Elasticomyces elasticus]KAK5757021.1 hypothetical protein LTS12_012835 [Elasticomyces elasticus]
MQKHPVFSRTTGSSQTHAVPRLAMAVHGPSRFTSKPQLRKDNEHLFITSTSSSTFVGPHSQTHGKMLLPRVTNINSTNNDCTAIRHDELVISRTTFIVAITLCIFITTTSLLGLAIFAYREYARQRQTEEAKSWGRRSRYVNRVSIARKQVDFHYSNQYGGCLVNIPENPELGPDGPVEIMEHERLCEVPAVPARTMNEDRRDARRSRLMSLFFDQGLGVWVPKGGR